MNIRGGIIVDVDMEFKKKNSRIKFLESRKLGLYSFFLI